MAVTWRHVDEVLAAGLAEGVYTAAVVLAGRGIEPEYTAAVGRLSGTPSSPAATLSTYFDLASLTKTLATTLALMLLVQEGRLPLTATLGEVLPQDWLPADKRLLSLTALLTHRSGLPAWRPYYETLLTLPPVARATALERLAAIEPLEHTPGPLTIYSDLGFMLLKAVVEMVAAEPLDVFCRRRLYEPLGLTTLGFRPREQAGDGNRNYAATEPGLIPGRLGQGEVHDENAWAAGGVAGHAGLFGTGPDVWRLAVHLWQAYTGQAADPFFASKAVQQFFTPPPGSPRALGFDRPASREASCGRYFSPQSIGHLGFTGVSFWIDLAQGLIV
ncbi:MAG: serine hydrolase domain-containing protein, partial [Desulfobacca sp.]|uniref:serine hydrolase domain-containing protein n=1 Tax=Desulfobacca sp. TaxID=2067990 RepID=UPI004049CC29